MNLEWTEPALVDLESIWDFIKRDSEYYASQFIERIIDAVENLKTFPEMGRNVPEAESENIRELLFNNYRIIYQVETERVLILTILHAARNLSQAGSKPWEII